MPLGAARLNSLGKRLIVVAEVIRHKKGIQAVGNAQVDTAQSKFGGASLLLDGTGDYLTVNFNSNTDFEFTAGEDFTIECFVRVNAYSQFNGLISLGSARSGNEYTLYIEGISGAYYATAANFGGANLSRGTTNLSTATWHHLAVSRSGTTVRLFVNGTLEDTDTYTFTAGQQSTIKIGSFSDGSLAFNGWIDEVRISKTARYTASFTAPTAAFTNDENTVLLIHADGTDATTFFEDDNGVRSPKGISALGNAQVDTAQSRFGGASLLLDGTGDALQCPTTGLALGTSDYTVECWVRFATLPSGFFSIIDFKFSNSSPNSPVLYMNNSTVNFGYGGTPVITTSTNLSTGTFYHFAVTRSGTSTKLFVNGTQSGSTYTDTVNATCDTFTIGNSRELGSGINGWIDEVRISNTARYTANFTSPTAPFVNDSNTLLLIHANGTDASTTFTDDNGTRLQIGITAFDNAKISTAQSKFGGASALFDGTNDRLVLATDSSLTMAADFTFEFWMYCSNVASPASQHFYHAVSTDTTIQMSGTGGSLIVYDGANRTIGTLTNNNWIHFAIVRSGSTIQCYLNGTAAGSSWTNSSTTRYTWSGETLFNRSNNLSAGFNGYIDEVRLSSSARYTANFTPATAPFQNDANTIFLMHMDGTNNSTVFIDDNGKTPT